MNIFEKRPLCLILCISLCGFLFFTFDNTVLRVTLIAIAILLCIISFILRINKDKRFLMRASAIAIIISCALSFLYFERYFKAYNAYDERIEVVGVVEDVSESSSYTQRLLVKAEKINGKGGKGYKFYAYPTKTEAKGIIQGARISFTAKLDGFSDDSYTYNISKGINAYASDVEDLKILEYTKGSVAVRFERFREYLTRYTISISDSDTGAILSALLLGQRDYLPDQLRLDFKRIGISHILALSGMHLAILSMGIDRALLFLRVKKKTRIATISSFVLLYMAITGFSVSVVRAGVMLILSSVLFLLGRTKDSLTSLSVAVLVICLFSPNSIMDISLWLSALATFGIIAFSEFFGRLEQPKGIKERAIRYITMSLLASVFAISATMAVSAFSFGSFSIFSPLTTIIFSLLAEIIMYLGCLMMLIGWFVPLNWIVSPLCRLMTVLAGFFSSAKFSYVSTNFKFVSFLIIIYSVCFYLFLVLKLKKPFKAINAIIIAYLVVTIIPTALTMIQNRRETVAYYSDTKSDQLLIRSKNEVCLINSSQYSKNLAYTSLDLLDDANVTHLDKYYLTHYSWSISDEIDVLMYNVYVEEIYVPEPRNDDEKTILKILYKTVENHRTKIVVFKENETVNVGEYTIDLLYSAPYGTTSVNAVMVAKNDEVYTYLSSGTLLTEMDPVYRELITYSDHIIFGEHGKKYKNKVYINDILPDLNNIILHSENVFLKQNNMQYFIDNGCKIYSHPKEIIYLKGK